MALRIARGNLARKGHADSWNSGPVRGPATLRSLQHYKWPVYASRDGQKTQSLNARHRKMDGKLSHGRRGGTQEKAGARSPSLHDAERAHSASQVIGAGAESPRIRHRSLGLPADR